MTNCLGIYFDENVVKYAKLIKNNAGTIEIKEHGIRFVKTTLIETLEKVVNDTNSTKDVAIVVSAPKVQYYAFQAFKQISNNDLQNVIKLEFEDWCEKKVLLPDNFSYVYTLPSNIIGDYRRGLMGICDKKLIEKYSKIGDLNVSSMYPTELLLPSNVPEEEKNYILIDMDENLTLTTIINGKITYISIFEIGMKQVFNKFIDVLGSYEKAYEACKQLNVFSDKDSDTNKVKLEEIVEPILQEILHDVTEDVNKYKGTITKIYITGSVILFTNIDTLFTEYFGLRCEILKPKFITDVGGVRNIAETLEVLPAIALAKEYLLPVTTKLEFIQKTIVKESFLNKLFGKNKLFNKNKLDDQKNKIEKEKIENKFNLSMLPDFTISKIAEYMMYPIIVFGLAIISYYMFSNIYMKQITKMKDELNTKIVKYEEMVSLTKSDTSLINIASSQYKNINDQVDALKKQIETNQIGKFTTYNVAAFTQKLIKVIPKNVQLKTISSDDNKKVKIVAQSDQYQNLGYFVADLRLQPDILTNVVINNVNNSSIITIEIGGDLP
ncbi:MAG: cell division FtsA domain-containing protein [Clostridia bacterium]|nr:cell division FtsA domain-containing protein [Clostridia bacterium]MDD4386280.1 cell division FtsA domain-containing protein [Clostridia bacterium]